MMEWSCGTFPVMSENLRATAPLSSHYCPYLQRSWTQGTPILQYTNKAAIFYAATFSFIQQAILVARLM